MGLGMKGKNGGVTRQQRQQNDAKGKNTSSAKRTHFKPETVRTRVRKRQSPLIALSQ
jgi:hypothetical protein